MRAELAAARHDIRGPIPNTLASTRDESGHMEGDGSVVTDWQSPIDWGKQLHYRTTARDPTELRRCACSEPGRVSPISIPKAPVILLREEQYSVGSLQPADQGIQAEPPNNFGGSKGA